MLAHTFCSGEVMQRKSCTAAEAGDAVVALVAKVSRSNPDIKVNLQAVAESLQEFSGTKAAQSSGRVLLAAAAPSHPEDSEEMAEEGTAANIPGPKKEKKKKRKSKDKDAPQRDDAGEDAPRKAKGEDSDAKQKKKKKKKA